MKEVQNVTFSLSKPLVRKFRVYAAKRNRSMTSLAEQAIQKLMLEDGDHEKATRRLIERMRNAPGRSIGGKITWTREELYER